MGDEITKDLLIKGYHLFDFDANLIVSEDGMVAKLIPFHGELKGDIYDEILKIIKNSPIVFGILEKPEIEDNKWVIAKGSLPIRGEDAKIRFKRPSGRIDLPDDITHLVRTSKIICYEKGDIIAEKILQTQGIPGRNVFGEEIPAEPGKWIAFPIGVNVEIFTEDQYIRAVCDGKLEFIDEKISIVENYRINGSINYSVGNVIFRGKLLEISGDVEHGFVVDVSGDLIVYGSVENSRVIVNGDLTVNGLVYGENCEILVKKNMICNVIEQANVKVNGNLTIRNYILDADCVCHENVVLKEKKALILGGYLTFGKTLIANVIGSEHGTTTYIYGGFLNVLMEEYEKLKEYYNENLKKISDIKSGLIKINEIEKHGKLDDKYLFIKKRLKTGLIDIINELKNTKEKINSIEKKIRNSPNPEIIVNKIIYPGVHITINNAHYEVKTEIKRAKFREINGDITCIKI